MERGSGSAHPSPWRFVCGGRVSHQRWVGSLPPGQEETKTFPQDQRIAPGSHHQWSQSPGPPGSGREAQVLPQDRTAQPRDLLPGATRALFKEPTGLTALSIKLLCETYHVKRAHQSGVCSKDALNESFPLFCPSFPRDPVHEPNSPPWQKVLGLNH